MNGPDRSLGEGVYYQPTDHVGIWRRVGIILIDGVVLFLLLMLGGFLYHIVGVMRNPQAPADQSAWDGALIYTGVLAYLILPKAVGIRTPGYWLMGCRLVDLRGKRPRFWRIVLREMLWLIVWFYFLFELAWCGMNNDRRSLRDCLCGTSLVRHDAQPAGTASIHLERISTMAILFAYPRVVRPRVLPQ